MHYVIMCIMQVFIYLIFACYMKMKVMMRLKSDNEESLLVDKKSMWIGYGLLKQSASDEKI